MRKRFLILIAIPLCILVLIIAFWRPLLRCIYVRSYEDIVAAYSAAYEVPEHLVNAVIWCESRFRSYAFSHAGACGLMQLKEPTFRELLTELELSERCDIFSPQYNIQCGVYYLHRLYVLYGNWQTALAAYNAGMGNVNEWLEDSRYSNDGTTLSYIPFRETENYIRKVTDVKEIYQDLYE